MRKEVKIFRYFLQNTSVFARKPKNGEKSKSKIFKNFLAEHIKFLLLGVITRIFFLLQNTSLFFQE